MTVKVKIWKCRSSQSVVYLYDHNGWINERWTWTLVHFELQDLIRLVNISGTFSVQSHQYIPHASCTKMYSRVRNAVPNSGNIVLFSHSSIVSPGASFTSTFQSRNNSDRKQTASTDANFFPRQTRGPDEKPRKVSIEGGGGADGSSDAAQRVGRYALGFGK